MDLLRFSSVQDFCALAQPYLLRHAAEHNLLLGIINNLLINPDRYSLPPYLAVVCSGEQVLAVAINTPPYRLVLSKVEDMRALTLIAHDIQTLSHVPAGVSGLVAEVEAFVQIWQNLTEQICQRSMEMRIHQLNQVSPMPPTAGQLRQATENDRPLLLQWYVEFADEIGDLITEPPEQAIDRGLKNQSIYLWENPQPLSWASGSQFLPTTARIGPVFTPVLYRRKGYATACVAALSQAFLDQGCQSCFLFTDLANPTSNHIYWNVGYRPICDWYDYTFKMKYI